MTTSTLSVQEAERLWTQLQQHFINAAQVIEEIIATEAWRPLGYQNFSDAWADRMGEITLANEIRPHVIWQMYHEGVDDDFVMSNVAEVGPSAASSYRRQYENGLPPELATPTPTPRQREHWETTTVVVHEHERERPSKADTIHLKVGVAMLQEYRRVAKKHNTNVEDLAMGFVREGFRKLV